MVDIDPTPPLKKQIIITESIIALIGPALRNYFTTKTLNANVRRKQVWNSPTRDFCTNASRSFDKISSAEICGYRILFKRIAHSFPSVVQAMVAMPQLCEQE